MLRLTLPLVAALVLVACSDGVETRPNVVLMLADDLGWGDVGHHAGPVPTPRIDRLFAGGVELETFLVSPLCSPTRAALLTGRHPVRVGFGGSTIGPVSPATLEPAELTLAEIFGAAGYATAIFGKWHLGAVHTPFEHGFDEFCGIYHGGADYFTRELENRAVSRHVPERAQRGMVWRCGGESRSEAGYTTDLIRDHALEFIGREDERPFFLYLPFTAPHTPLQAPPEVVARVPASVLGEDERVYRAMVLSLDDAVGAILDKLGERGLEERTIVVFASDNGAAEEHGNRPFRGNKGTLYEGGVRSPTAILWPGRLPAGLKVDAMLAVEDLAPTLLALAGIERSAGPPLDGRDFSALLAPGPAGAQVRDEVTWISRTADGLRTPRWKLIRRMGAKELYDLAADPGESRDLAEARPEVVAELEARLDAWEASVPAYPSHVPVAEAEAAAPEGAVVEIRVPPRAPSDQRLLSVAISPARSDGARGQVTAPGDRLEYDLLIAEGPVHGFFVDYGFNPRRPWAPFFSAPAVDQHGTLQGFASGFPQAAGRWAHRVVGLANRAPTRAGGIRIAFTRAKLGHRLYLDNPRIVRADGEVIELYREGDLRVRIEPETAAESVEVREVPLSQIGG